jgi:hypothetical protein
MTDAETGLNAHSRENPRRAVLIIGLALGLAFWKLDRV